MALHNLAREYSTTTGISNAVLTGAVPGFNTWDNAGVTNGETVRYGIKTYSLTTGRPTHSETGTGTYTTSTKTVARTTVISSTNGGSKITLTGLSEVFITAITPDINPYFRSIGSTNIERPFLQLGLSRKPFYFIYPAGTNSAAAIFWGGSTNSGTASATDDATFGYMINLATSTAVNGAAGRAQTTAYFSRGNNHYRGGFSAYSRVGLSEKDGLYFYMGFASVSLMGATGVADDPGGDYALFQYSPTRGGAGDTNFQFITKDNTTQHVTDTGVAVTINKVYDFFVYCPMASSTIYWRIQNITDATEASGSKTNNLPTSTTNMASQLGIVNQSGGTAKNFKFTMFLAEPDDVDTP